MSSESTLTFDCLKLGVGQQVSCVIAWGCSTTSSKPRVSPLQGQVDSMENLTVTVTLPYKPRRLAGRKYTLERLGNAVTYQRCTAAVSNACMRVLACSGTSEDGCAACHGHTAYYPISALMWGCQAAGMHKDLQLSHLRFKNWPHDGL